MARVYRSPLWPLVAVLLALYLAHDLGAAQVQPQSPQLAAMSMIRVKYVPDPKDIVNLAEGTPYVVPEGKLLIITDYTVTNPVTSGGSVPFSMQPRIRIDGVDTWGTGWAAYGADNTSASTLSHALQTGIRVNAGAAVTLHANPFTGSGGAWYSYLGMPDAPKMFAAGYLAAAP